MVKYFKSDVIIRVLKEVNITQKVDVKQCKVEVKVKLSLCLTKYHAMKAYWGMEV
jgi:hypothetical protein